MITGLQSRRISSDSSSDSDSYQKISTPTPTPLCLRPGKKHLPLKVILCGRFFFFPYECINWRKSGRAPTLRRSHCVSSWPELTDDPDECSRQRCKAQTRGPGCGQNSDQAGLFVEPGQKLPGSCWALEKRSQAIGCRQACIRIPNAFLFESRS